MEQQTPRPNGMAVAAMILGISSLLSTCCSGAGFPIAAIGIILALLSRRGNTMSTQAKAGLGLSLGALILSIVIFASGLLISVATGQFKVLWDAVYDMDLNEFEDQQELQDYLYDVLEEYNGLKNGVSPHSDTPITFDFPSNTL